MSVDCNLIMNCQRVRSSRIVWPRNFACAKKQIQVGLAVMPVCFWRPCFGLYGRARGSAILPMSSANGPRSAVAFGTRVFQGYLNLFSMACPWSRT